MTTGEPLCDQRTLSRFLDQEVESEECSQIVEHVKQCQLCRRALKDHESISSLFKADLTKEISRAKLEGLEEDIITVLQRREVSWLKKVSGFLTSRKFYLPAAAVATALALFVYLTGSPAPVSGPSAIINSFTGEMSSVMIIEIPTSRRTILWYHETSMPSEDDNGVQKG